MPSDKNPANVVHPGPGKLSSGVATASAFIFPGGGGGGSAAALHAHIVDPMDAHMAGAIGIPATDPVTGLPILASAGGPVDGESVFDFIVAAKDLFPIRPNVLGFATVGVPNTGVPNWHALNERPGGAAYTGAFTRGTAVIPTHELVDGSSVVSTTVDGTLYPADRGVLALYYCTNGAYLTPAGVTLVAALWLNGTPAPAGIPSATFDEARRAVDQLDHTATGVGLDNITLTHRLPYLEDYSGYSGYYANYDSNFYRYQLAHYSYPITIPAQDAGSWIFVHWRETYATSLTAIQPLAMSTHLTSAYCYSAMPSGGDFDTGEIRTANRHNVYRDTTLSAPIPNTYTVSVVGSPSTVMLSGVSFYNNGSTPLQWNLNLSIDDILTYCYYTGTTASPGNIPAGFESGYPPMTIDFSDFGGDIMEVPYHHLRDLGTLTYYSLTHAPAPGETNVYNEANVPIYGSLVSASPIGGYGTIHGIVRKPFLSNLVWADTPRYLFNSYAQTGSSTASTSTYEPFTDERFRYSTATVITASLPVEPSVGNHFDSTAVIAAADDSLQVVGHQLVYPHANFASGYQPVGPDYAAVLAADASDWIRYHMRAFDTGVPRNTGKLRIRGIRYADISSSTANPVDRRDGHTGGAIVLIKVPGQTGWLDLGRAYGVPDLDTTQNNRGCMTGVTPNTTSTDFTVTYNTGLFTANNGSGEFPIFIAVILFKNGAGEALAIDDITWEAP